MCQCLLRTSYIPSVLGSEGGIRHLGRHNTSKGHFPSLPLPLRPLPLVRAGTRQPLPCGSAKLPCQRGKSHNELSRLDRGERGGRKRLPGSRRLCCCPQSNNYRAGGQDYHQIPSLEDRNYIKFVSQEQSIDFALNKYHPNFP